MYKYLIVGIAFMFTVSGAYYINKSGGGDLLASALSGGPRKNSISPTLESVAGVYTCDSTSGCTNKFVLMLRDDQTAEMIQVSSTDDTTTGAIYNNTGNSGGDGNGTVINSDTLDTSSSSSNTDLSPTSSDTPSTSNETTTESVLNITENSPLSPGPTISQESKTNAVVADLENSSTSITEKGSWDLGVQNMLVVTFTGAGTTTYEVPQKLVVKNVETSMLSKIHYTKSSYRDMVDPVFVKQD